MAKTQIAYGPRPVTQAAVRRAQPALVTIDAGCTACGLCLITCPERVLVPAPGRPAVIAGRCTGCMACVEVCPRDVIRVVRS